GAASRRRLRGLTSPRPVAGARGYVRLVRPRLAEQLRVDGEADAHRPAEHLAGRLADAVGERLLQPVLEEEVRHADRQDVVGPAEAGVLGKPEVVAWLPDAPGDSLPQRRHDVALAGRHSISWRARTPCGPRTWYGREEGVRAREGNPAGTVDLGDPRL